MAHLKYLLATLLCGLALAQSGPTTVMACNMKAISSAERTRFSALLGRIKAGVTAQKETPEGYVWELAGTTVTLKEAAEWAMLERRCCPFLVIQLEVTGGGSDFRIALKGPVGVKAFLISEFGVAR